MKAAPSLSRPALRNTGFDLWLAVPGGTTLLYGEMRFDSAASFAAKSGSHYFSGGRRE